MTALTKKREDITTRLVAQPFRSKVEMRSPVLEVAQKFSLGTFNYELDGQFRETQYVPIFPYFYESQGFSAETVQTAGVRLYLGTLKYVMICC